jgi:hypothetical protein
MLESLKDTISKSLLTGAMNSLSSLIIFQGSDIIDFKFPGLGNLPIPDSIILGGSAFAGQMLSDYVHDLVYQSIPQTEKLRSTQTALLSLISYNVAQIPFIMLGKMPLTNIPQYLIVSSLAHYGSEAIFHDVLSKKTGGILI